MLGSSSVDDQANPIPNVVKGAETSVKVFDEFGHFVSPSFTDMGLIHNQDDFDMLVHVEQSLNKERVADLNFLTIIVLEARTVIEGHPFNINLSGNPRLRQPLVSNDDLGLFHGGRVVKDWV